MFKSSYFTPIILPLIILSGVGDGGDGFVVVPVCRILVSVEDNFKPLLSEAAETSIFFIFSNKSMKDLFLLYMNPPRYVFVG